MKRYDNNPEVCSCGFDGLGYPVYENPELYRTAQIKMRFRVFKYAKKVFYGNITYSPSDVLWRDGGGRQIIEGTADKRGLILIDRAEKNVGEKTVADEGLLAFKTDAAALILNVDYVNSNFLDESRVETLFLGKDVKGFKNGIMLSSGSLRYLTVHDGNEHYKSLDNVLFSKDMKRLVCYPPDRPEKEYLVPSSVEKLEKFSFRFPAHLEKLHLPSGISGVDEAFVFRDGVKPEIVYY